MIPSGYSNTESLTARSTLTLSEEGRLNIRRGDHRKVEGPQCGSMPRRAAKDDQSWRTPNQRFRLLMLDSVHYRHEASLREFVAQDVIQRRDIRMTSR
jgi:hypothetical protein